MDSVNRTAEGIRQDKRLIMGIPVNFAPPDTKEEEFDGRERGVGWLKVCDTDRVKAKFRLNKTLPFFEIEELKEEEKKRLLTSLERFEHSFEGFGTGGKPLAIKITTEEREDFLILLKEGVEVSEHKKPEPILNMRVRMPGKTRIEHWDEAGITELLTELCKIS